tara:strand:+ start:1643 stop:2737 length:1095 start_codon:yes stop_codon:yes gene_type:complete
MNWIKVLSIQIIVLVGLLGLVELGVSLFYKLFYKSAEFYSLDTFIEQVPAPFKDDDNFELIVKSFNGKCKHPAMLHNNGLTTYANDFSCGGVTYVNGKRLTLPNNENYKSTIHVFGGSTVWGTGAVDQKTIPSLLASSLTDKNVRVLNYGIASFVAAQQNNHLKAFLSDVLPGDKVLYYDGGNDFWNGVMMRNAGGNIVGFNVENRFDVYIYVVKNWLSQNFKIYQLLYDLRHGRKDKSINKCSVSSEAVSKNVDEAAHFYASAISEARSISESAGANFYHFVQPTLFDVDVLSEYEKIVISHDPCWSIARQVKESYDKIFLSLSPMSIDLSEKFNNKDVFFDYIHVSGIGNKLIVSDILSELD